MSIEVARLWKAVCIYKDAGVVQTFDPCLKVSEMDEPPAHFISLRRRLDLFQPDWTHEYFEDTKNRTKVSQTSGMHVLLYMDSVLHDTRLSFVTKDVSPHNS